MKSQSAKPPASFETALQELEGLVRSLEEGNAKLEDSLQAYERGVLLLKYCQDTLGQAEQKVRLLDSGILREGLPASTAQEEGEIR